MAAYACRIKFCGLRTAEDVRCAAELGADAVGFVMSESARRVAPQEARRLRRELPDGIRVHAVFGLEPAETVRRLFEESGADVAQVVFPQDVAAYRDALGDLPVLPCFRVRDDGVLRDLGAAGAGAFLLDAYVPGKAGGTGERFDWSIARRASAYGKVILAGGLTPENVGEAVRAARPCMVDVSGGIERERGVKDPQRMRDFAHAVRRAAAALNGETQ